MKNKLFIIMSEVFGVDVDKISVDSSSENIKNWDSLKHMNLIITLEEEFNITFEEDDIPEMQNVKKILTSIVKAKS